MENKENENVEVNSTKEVKKVEKTEKVEPKKVETKKEDVKKSDSSAKKLDDKTKKIILFGGIGLGALVIVVSVIILLVSILSKPSKKVAQDLVKDYLEAINEKDTDKFESLIDTKGYLIFKEEGIKKFDTKYKEKDKYLSKYMKEKDYDDIDDVTSKLSKSFKSLYQYDSKEYSLKEIVKIEKSTKSKKVIVIKAKVKVKKKNSDSSDTKNFKLYVTKVNGKYKVVGAEFDDASSSISIDY